MCVQGCLGHKFWENICGWHEPPGSPKKSQGAIGQSADVSHHLIRPTGWGPAGHVTCSELFIRQCSFECGYMENICTYLLYPNILYMHMSTSRMRSIRCILYYLILPHLIPFPRTHLGRQPWWCELPTRQLLLFFLVLICQAWQTLWHESNVGCRWAQKFCHMEDPYGNHR